MQVMDMWHQYRLVGSADAQINVTFDSTSLGHLHALMPVEERFMFKVLMPYCLMIAVYKWCNELLMALTDT